jgi:hypothetical protein
MVEYMALMTLDYRGNTAAVVAQPMRIAFCDGTTHVPDYFGLGPSGEQTVYDVRPEELVDDKFLAQARNTLEVCDRVGWRYEILIGHSRTVTQNLEFVAQFRHMRYAPDDVEFEWILSQVDDGTTLGALRTVLEGYPSALQAAFHLMWQRQINFDMSISLNWSTPLKRRPNAA